MIWLIALDAVIEMGLLILIILGLIWARACYLQRRRYLWTRTFGL